MKAELDKIEEKLKHIEEGKDLSEDEKKGSQKDKEQKEWCWTVMIFWLKGPPMKCSVLYFFRLYFVQVTKQQVYIYGTFYLMELF